MQEAKLELDTAKERQHEVLQAMARSGDSSGDNDQVDKTKEAIELLGKASSADGLEARQLLVTAKAKLAEIEKKLGAVPAVESSKWESSSQASDVDMATVFADFADDLLADVEALTNTADGSKEVARTKLQKRLGESDWKLVRKKGKTTGA